MGMGNGKLDPEFMDAVVYRNLGRASSRVRLGPGLGRDNAIISLAGGEAMIITTDPVSAMPEMGMRLSAWLSVHLIASDYATTGLSPEFATFCYNFPPELSRTDREDYVEGIGDACGEVGVAIVAGNTGAYPGAGLTVIGGGTMFGLAREGTFVDSTMSRPGDRVVMTKGSAIEATASLAYSFPDYVGKRVGERTAARARDLVGSCSTVKDSLTAARIGLGPGRVTSMHDATEGGVLGGLAEMCAASKNSIVVDLEEILVSEVVARVCSAFEIDPLRSLSEGTLLLTVAPEMTEVLQKALRSRGIRSAQIGEVRPGRGLWSRRDGGRLKPVRLSPDPYWAAYEKARTSSSRSRAGAPAGGRMLK